MRRFKDIAARILIYLSAAVTVGILLWLIGYIVFNGIGSINWHFLTDASGKSDGGIMPMIVSTLYLILVSIVIACPIGISAAIFLTEYAKQGKLVRIIRFATECLAGIPSIIYGLFGMLLFVTQFKWSWSIIAGACTLSIMVLPTVVRATEEAIKSVPDTYREGSYGLGANKLRTILRIVLPSAVSGILAAVILSIGRVVGETAAVLLTAGTVLKMPYFISDSGRSLAVHLYILAKEGISFEKAYATATILIITVAVINLAANLLASKFKKV